MKKYTKVFVYLRFSSEGQADGNSFERQRVSAEGYLRRTGISESTVEWVEDPAFSAFHGDHVKSGALGKLLRRVREGAISNGLLIFEAVDRASRQGSMSFFAMLHEFLEAGFSIYFLDQPDTEPFDKKAPPPFFFTFLSMKADIAQYESQRKSDFSSKNWEKRRRLARDEKQVFTAECPRWLTIVNNEYVVNSTYAESIEMVFRLAAQKWGISKIVRFANEQQWPVPANGQKWHLSLLNRLFNNRALIGEFQPHKGSKSRRQSVGDAILDYYPIAVDIDLFHSVQRMRSASAVFPNRTDDNNYNYLMGLGKCECGGTWRRLNKNSGKQKGYAQYSCSNRQLGASKCANISGKMFDANFIGLACERIPELITVIDDKRAERKSSLESQLADVVRRISRLLDLFEISDELPAEVAERFRNAKIQRIKIQEQLRELEGTNVENPFNFGDAVSAYLPAFIDYFEDSKTKEAQDAQQARALFRGKLLQSVESVTVGVCRLSMTIKLLNGSQFTHEIRVIEFGSESDFTEVELNDMESEHQAARTQLLALSS